MFIGKPIKVGLSTDLMERWLGFLQHYPEVPEIRLIGHVPGTREREKWILRSLRSWRLRGEWFSSEALPLCRELFSDTLIPG